MNWKTFGHKLSAVGTLLAGGSIATAFLTVVPADAPQTWIQIVHNIAIGSVIVGAVLSGFGKVISTWLDTDDDEAPEKQFPPPHVPLVIIALLCLASLAGCASTVEVRKSVKDQTTATAAASEDIKFLAGYIADAWAAKEIECAVVINKAAIKSHTVQAQVVATATTIPDPANPAPKTISTVDENTRASLVADHNRVLARIEFNRTKLKATIIARYTQNIAAAQALLQGQANYYAQSDSTSTLQTGIDSALTEFQKYAPLIVDAVTKKKS